MGTNYFFCTPKCHCCGHYKDKKHIGKRSWGWQFYFQGYPHDTPPIRSYDEWLLEFANNPDYDIRDEYEEWITIDEFKHLVEQARSERLNHYTYCQESGQLLEHDWIDKDGHPFSSRHFS